MGRLIFASSLLATFVGATAPARTADYRGMSAGWPAQANGAYAANYPANYGTGPAYFVARPVVGTPQRAFPTAPRAVAYVPVNAAYGNPSYFAAYRGATAPAYPTQHSPHTAYYPPSTTANYAPNYSYAVSPAGVSSSGSEAAASYAQPTPQNYVPPNFSYRTTYAAVPVYMYRPVTAYQPVVAQPVTCLQPAVATTCQPQRTRCFSWLNPFTWFRRSSCGSAPVAAAPTVAYCTSGASPCGQPYYPAAPVTPVIPSMPAPASQPIITTPIPSGPLPPAGRTIPPPPTRAPFSSGGTLSPADVPPRLTPGTITPGPITPFPSTPFPSTPLPSTPAPTAPGTSPFPSTPLPGSFPTQPGAAPGFGGGPAPSGSFSSGSNYRPTAETNTIRSPELGPALPPSIQTVPDLDAGSQERPSIRAPQLLDPRDKTAARASGATAGASGATAGLTSSVSGADQRWAVVRAVWPKKEPVRIPVQAVSVSTPADYDDSGWKSAR